MVTEIATGYNSAIADWTVSIWAWLYRITRPQSIDLPQNRRIIRGDVGQGHYDER